MSDLPPSSQPVAALADLLQTFAQTPGNFPVRLGEPRLLYAHLDTIAGWAVGRVPEELADRAEALREAAVFFVLRACFSPDSTHYQVMGLSPKQLTPESLRLRYRALIRLTHPDMGVQGLPPNAAGVVNRANEVLSDPELRRRYDDQLAAQQVSKPAARLDESAVQIALHTSWAERWQSIVARYPRLVRVVPATLGISAVGLGALAWIASSGNDSRLLIVARADGEAVRQSSGQGSPPKGGIAADSTANGYSVSQPRPVNLAKPVGKVDVVTDSPVAMKPAVMPPRDVKEVRQSRSEADAAEPSPNLPAPPRPPQSRGGEEPMQVAAVNSARAEPARPPVPRPPASAAASPVAAPPPTLAPPPTSDSAPPPAPVPPLFRVAAPAPDPTPAVSAWSVDAPQAKTYLADMIMSLERPNRARRNNGYLADMNVKGSLLQPAIQLMRRYPQMEVEHMNWTDSSRPGAMTLQGQVTVRARNPDTGEVRKVNFLLSAEFWGTRSGTVMASLNLREDD